MVDALVWGKKGVKKDRDAKKQPEKRGEGKGFLAELEYVGKI